MKPDLHSQLSTSLFKFGCFKGSFLGRTTISSSLLIFFIAAMFFLGGCNIAPEEEPIPEPEPKPVFPELFRTDTTVFEIGVNDTIVILFTEEYKGFDSTYTINGNLYRPYFNKMSIEGVEIDTAWKSTDTLLVWGKKLFQPNASYTLNFYYDWRNLNSVIQETVSIEFTINISSVLLPVEEIIATYPIDRQYYFLQNEHNQGFFLLKRLPLDVSSLYVIIEQGKRVVHSSPITSDDAGSPRLNFELPQLENEKIYSIKLNSNNELIYQIYFRTSKYNTLAEKLVNIQPTSQVFREMVKAWMFHFITQRSSISIEGFDKAEVQYATETIQDMDFRYCTGLLQLESTPAGTTWYDTYIYPILYAPFSDPDFTPEYAYHPNLGRECQYAMDFYFYDRSELPELTDAEIAAGTAAPVFQADFTIRNQMPAATAYDYLALRTSAGLYYNGSGQPLDARIQTLIFDSYLFAQEGNYRYKINYRLPDGTITSSYTYDMLLTW